MKDIVGVILAAGEGTRMKSAVPKVLHNLWGMPVLLHTIRALKCAGIDRIIVVVGYKSERIKEHLKGFEIVTQKELLGTADALYRTRKALFGFDGTVLVVCADAPLIKTDTILKLIHMHRDEQAACSLLSAELRDPTGYGRIIRNDEGEVVRIVEENDASIYQRVVPEVNSGAYCFDSKKLFAALDEIMLRPKRGEYYLTDTIDFFKRHKDKVVAHATDDPSEIIGINSRNDLALAHDILRKRIIEEIISGGVTVIDPGTTFISSNVTIGQDTIIYPFVFIEADVNIGKNCSVGPFCRIRSSTTIEDDTRIGNFVEITRSHIKRGTKINHFSYLGDAAVGSKVNIGAGTITANYNGKSKNKTFIGNDAFIGSGTILIAPVRIGDYATTGAGCVVPKGKDIPKGSVAIGVPARILKKSKRSHSK
jgi:bifunctional UDP-N-acetylglucosamine pyrophosphorylase/glucosamine-1-phosphate N-acetyltransferase